MTSDIDEAVLEAVKRKDVLVRLSEGTAQTHEIEEVAGVSSSTAYRILSSFEKNGFVEKDGSGEYRITPVGEAVMEEVDGFYESFETVVETQGILDVLNETGVDIDPGAFTDGNVVRSEREHPYRPARRFVEMFRESDELRLLAVSSATPMFTDEMHEMIANGRETEIVCPEIIVETNLESMSDEMMKRLPEYLSVHVHDDPPVTVALFDDTVGFGGHDPEKGTLDVFADTDETGTYAEAEDLYESYLREAERYL